MAHFILRLYASLLRLYPPRFQAEFAEEMREVFALALDEAEQEGALALVAICLAELRDLPLSVIREHLRGRRQKQLILEAVMLTGMPFHIYRFCIVILLSIPFTYGLFVVVPFFALGLHLQPANLVAGGTFDPGGMPFYMTPVGQIIHLIGFCSVFPGLICLPSLNVPLVWILARHWRRWTQQQRWLGVLTVIVSLGTLAFMRLWQTNIILAWFMD